MQSIVSRMMTKVAVGALVLAPACDPDTAPESNNEVVFDADDAPVSDEPIGTVLASIEGAQGARLTFLDLEDGIAVLETRSARQPSALIKVQAEDPTPLEIYLAAEGDEPAVLARLTLHHDEVAKQPPRPLKANPRVTMSPEDLSEEGFHPIGGYCTATNWVNSWHADLNPLSQYDAADHYVQEYLASPLYFAPGSSPNTKTWIGGCVADHNGSEDVDDKWLRIEKLQSGVWSTVETHFLDAAPNSQQDAYTFYAYHPGGARYRGRLSNFVNNDPPVDPDYGWGLAWTPYTIINP
ncbi:hypothetical protein POL25_19180 [Nannocystis sp. bb15-2]|uniref:Uncharacterized protein n=2 Tax=Nannocystis bainbridge TaxID=2995303 RepID=A0ABT5DZH5_9BACT|nr:hypothetical protein [Nannocystis bainbridge]